MDAEWRMYSTWESKYMEIGKQNMAEQGGLTKLENTEITYNEIDKNRILRKTSKEAREIIKETFKNSNQTDMRIVDSFKTGKRWWNGNSNIEKKIIYFTFNPSTKEKEKWKSDGIHKLSSMITYLKKKYGSLSKFEIIFFRNNNPKTFYFKKVGPITHVYVGLDQYEKYHTVLNPEISKLKIFKYKRKISFEYGQKVPVAFFNNDSPESLVTELKESNYKIIEDLIGEYENMDNDEKNDLKTIFGNSTLADDTIQEFVNLKPESTKKQLKLFLKILDNLSKKELEILLNKILSSKSSQHLINAIGELSIKDQNKISKNLPEMAKMHAHYKKLEKSLNEFTKKIDDHVKTNKKNEKDIHKFLIKNYWLLGIEYFDSKIYSDVDKHGKLTGKTNIGRKRADFIILKRLSGIDTCTVIEIEEANDRIFNKDKTISKKVYDGIIQALDYNLEQKARGSNSRGMAIIGSLKFLKLDDEEQKRLLLLKNSFSNIEI